MEVIFSDEDLEPLPQKAQEKPEKTKKSAERSLNGGAAAPPRPELPPVVPREESLFGDLEDSLGL